MALEEEYDQSSSLQELTIQSSLHKLEKVLLASSLLDLVMESSLAIKIKAKSSMEKELIPSLLLLDSETASSLVTKIKKVD